MMHKLKQQKSPAKKTAHKKVAKKNHAKKLHKTPKRTLSTSAAFGVPASAGETIAFAGLGEMGRHMAHNLMKNGHDLVVYDVFEPNIQRVVDFGKSLGRSVTIAKSPAEAALNADVFITMLPSSPHVKETYTGDNGIFSVLKQRQEQGRKKLLLIDSSTIAPPVAKELAELVKTQYSEYATNADAPVSGGVVGSENGTLTFMVGAPEETFNAAKPYLQKMGKNIVHCGDNSTGQIAKVCNNLILGISMNAISESFNLGVKLGMDPKTLAGIVNNSSGYCWASQVGCPVPGVVPTAASSRDYAGGFAVDLMLKDMNLALDAAKVAGVELDLGKTATNNYAAVSTGGAGKKDFGYIYQHLLNRGGDEKM